MINQEDYLLTSGAVAKKHHLSQQIQTGPITGKIICSSNCRQTMCIPTPGNERIS